MAIKLFSNGTDLKLDPLVIDYEGPYTLAYWQRINGFTPTLAIDFATTPYVEQEKVGYDSSGQSIQNGIDNVFAAGTPPVDSLWYHIVLVRTDSANAKIYMDGVQIIDNPTDVAPRGSSNYIDISKSGNSSRTVDLQNMRVWTAALSLPEIAAERVSLTPVRSADLLDHWEFADTTDIGTLSVIGGSIQDTDGPVLSVPGPDYAELQGMHYIASYVDANGCIVGWAMRINDVTPA